ncbi:MAG: hypothetical protein AVDCRST_MAG22-3833 [uncultured Rubrobacteraceae bacterium]|uniref:Uncharacterized protein n=1 Tax=uncultured Rubrobacteraceae bacterium TaxID=349277 RepID=A0A6J4Q9Y4_9ACTN|nr:MAG: hypothetical protein AVDCRST_MAG22-3833 [uncultured Rubrobacteraceae bacterium]
MNTWGKVAAGVVLGVAGTIYATSEEARKNLPRTARDLPANVRRRYERAVSAAREASTSRKQEILRDLERHDRAHSGLAVRPDARPEQTRPPETASPAPAAEAARPPENPEG